MTSTKKAMSVKGYWIVQASGFIAILSLCASIALAQYPAEYPSKPQISMDGTEILVEDYASLPQSSFTNMLPYPPPFDPAGQFARENALRSEPANAPRSASRIFVVDGNGNLYILDKATRRFTPYIDFGKVFPRFFTNSGYGTGVVSIAFDPDYAKNGKFYTVHTENPKKAPAADPTNAAIPSLILAGYTTTPVVNPPAGEALYESVLVEWTDTNIRNETFEGTAREILRVGFNAFIHQMGDMLFNPLAKPGQSDYGNLYLSLGDGASGETPGPTHPTPQRLDALQGKILRINPDIKLRPKDMLSANGRYRIPSSGSDPNPFVSIAGARPEIFAYGLRNPHRMTWDTVTNMLIADDVGLHSWEEVNIVTKGANYGYGEREGNELLLVDQAGKTGTQLNPPVPFPGRDLLNVAMLSEPVAPLYPVAVYSHMDGDAIGSGFVYRGKLMPRMVGKYFFTDITTGRLFYTDLAEMIASHSERNHQATIHEIQVIYNSPYDTQGAAKHRLYDIVADTFVHKGGVPTTNAKRSTLPRGRSDVRLSVDGDGEIYVLSKSDGMIRKLVSVVTPPPASRNGSSN